MALTCWNGFHMQSWSSWGAIVHWGIRLPNEAAVGPAQNKWNDMEHATRNISKILEACEDTGANSVLT